MYIFTVGANKQYIKNRNAKKEKVTRDEIFDVFDAVIGNDLIDIDPIEERDKVVKEMQDKIIKLKQDFETQTSVPNYEFTEEVVIHFQELLGDIQSNNDDDDQHADNEIPDAAILSENAESSPNNSDGSVLRPPPANEVGVGNIPADLNQKEGACAEGDLLKKKIFEMLSHCIKESISSIEEAAKATFVAMSALKVPLTEQAQFLCDILNNTMDKANKQKIETTLKLLHSHAFLNSIPLLKQQTFNGQFTTHNSEGSVEIIYDGAADSDTTNSVAQKFLENILLSKSEAENKLAADIAYDKHSKKLSLSALGITVAYRRNVELCSESNDSKKQTNMLFDGYLNSAESNQKGSEPPAKASPANLLAVLGFQGSNVSGSSPTSLQSADISYATPRLSRPA